MAIFHFRVDRITRSSGRSAMGAAAYRTGEKLYNEHDSVTHDYTKRRNAVGSSAYHSGEKLNEHDFSKKSDVVYSEIMLPKHATVEYQDRQTLWNAVEKSEKRHDAQTARIIVVALPVEMNTEQHIELLREHIKENFVDKGMCADYSIHSGHIHSKKDEVYPFQDLAIQKDNPHAHIQLTVRPLNPDGSWGNKTQKEYILDKNGNRIKLKSGKGWRSRNIPLTDWEKPETLEKWRANWALTVNKAFERLGMDERISHLSLKAQGIECEPTIHMGHEAWNIEKKGAKTDIGDINRGIMRRNVKKHKNHENTAEYMQKLKQNYLTRVQEITTLRQTETDIRREIVSLKSKGEEMTERAEQIRTTAKRIEELRIQRLGMGFLQSKKGIDEQIGRLEHSHEQATKYFKRNYSVNPSEVMAEVSKLEHTAQHLKLMQEQLSDRIIPLEIEEHTYLLEYQRIKLLAEINSDKHNIQAPRTQSERVLETVSDQNFQEILKSATHEQAKALIERLEREKERERERIKKFERTR